MATKKRKRKLTRRKFIKSAAVVSVSASQMKAIGEMQFEEYDLIASISRESFYEFVKEFWHEAEPRPFVDNWHIKYICDEFQKVAERVFKGLPKENDLIINVSPGQTKSLTYSVMSLPWIWTRMPIAKFIGGSHSHELSLDLSRKSRAVIKSEKYRKAFPNIRLSSDQDAKGYYVNTLGGSRRSSSVDSKVTGFHGDFFAVDDPIDPREIMTDTGTKIKNANDWMSDVVFQRRTAQDTSVTILIMQRLHENDPTAHMMNRAKDVQRLAIQQGDKDAPYKIKHICIPAEVTDRVKPKTLKKFYRNGLMDPVKLPRNVLNEKGIDPFMYAGQYLQQPSPRGGGMFKVERIKIENVLLKMKWVKRVRFWDKAGTLGGRGAFTVGVLMGLDRDGKFYILDVIRFREGSAVREGRIKQTAESDGRDIYIGIEQEPGSGGKESAENTVRNLAGWKVRIDKPSGSDSSKEMRADPFSVQVNIGNVVMIPAEWNREYLNELQHFPASTYKDQVDASSGAFNQLNQKRYIVGPVFGRRNYG